MNTSDGKNMLSKVSTMKSLATLIVLLGSVAAAQAQLLSGDRVNTTAEGEAPEEVAISPEQVSDESPPFGFNLFQGGFRSEREDGLNEEYLVQPGDRITLRIWGATSIDQQVVVDAQGNIFIPGVGPIRVWGIRNGDLNKHIARKLRTVFTQNVNIYTNLQGTQPTIVYVTGYVETPGSYAGVASDSVLYFISRAGGIISQQGSYRSVLIKHGDKLVARIDLYDFLTEGTLPKVQFMDGDTVIVERRGEVVTVEGEARNKFAFEFRTPDIPGSRIVDLARPRAHASHATISGSREAGPFAAYVTVAKLDSMTLRGGDRIKFEADRREETILVRVEGSHLGPSRFAVPKDTTLLELLDYIEVDPNLADINAVSLRRKSIAERQKSALEDTLRRLEIAVIGASSQTDEESQIRVREAALISSFVDRARKVKPEGILVVAENGKITDIQLEPGDIVTIPPRSHTVLVSGEVMVPQALVYSPKISLAGYIEKVGGFTDRADPQRTLVVHRNGEVVVQDEGLVVQPGDEILVLPAVPVKNLQIASTITEVIFRIALAAATVFGL